MYVFLSPTRLELHSYIPIDKVLPKVNQGSQDRREWRKGVSNGLRMPSNSAVYSRFLKEEGYQVTNPIVFWLGYDPFDRSHATLELYLILVYSVLCDQVEKMPCQQSQIATMVWAVVIHCERWLFIFVTIFVGSLSD